METLKFVIVGHVDHGKSTLIGRLLYDTKSLPPDRLQEIKKGGDEKEEFAHLLDHLEEERSKGITIDTTQVFFRTSRREYVIIDAPGHVEFIRNMITGASQAEAGVLIVDVTEGVKEQTRRHAYILALLGIKHIIVVVNKMDLVDYRRELFEKMREELESFLPSLGVEVKFYIPVSAWEGVNIARPSSRLSWFEGPSFLSALDELPSRPSLKRGDFLFPIQDVYRIKGEEIVVGRVEGGEVGKGDRLRILPGKEEGVVRKILRFPQEVDKAQAGECVGMVLEGEISPRRGEVLCHADSPPSLHTRFQASIFWMSPQPAEKEKTYLLRCATQERNVSLTEILTRMNSSTFEILERNAYSLHNLEVGEVVMEVDRPLVVKPFQDLPELGRFVLEKEGEVCAGGVVRRVGEG